MEPPSWPTIGEWIGLAAFLLLTALSSCAETALMAASRLRLQHLRREGVSRARAIESVLAHPDILASTIHLLSLIGTVGATTMIIAVMWRLNQATWSMVVAAVLAFFLVLILGQIVPRVVAVQNPDAAALIFARPIELLAHLFSPFIQAIATMTRVLLRLVGVRQQLAAPLVTEEQLRLLANAADDIEENEREMIDGIFDLEETLAREVMVPRVDIVAVPADCTAGDAIDLVLDRGRTRLPVYEESLDHILGVVHAHSLFRALRSGQPETSVRDLMHPAYFIPDSKRVDDLLSEMQLKKIHLAIVVDEYGGTAGLLTIEDLVEEIVGEIQDEYGDENEAERVKQVAEDEWLLDAGLSIDDVNDLLELDLEAEEYDTVGGLVYHQLGKMPEPGDVVKLPALRLEVLTTAGHRIRQLRVRKEQPTPVTVEPE